MLFSISTPAVLRKSGKVISTAVERELDSIIEHQSVKNDNAKAVLADELRTRKLKQLKQAKVRAAKLNELVADVVANTTDIAAAHKLADDLLDGTPVPTASAS